MNKKLSLLAMAALTLLFACKKNDTPANTVKPLNNGIYVLSQGGIGNNDAALAFYDSAAAKVTTNIFQAINNRQLGDVANDMQLYGGKLYIVMNNSNSVEIVQARTGQSLAHISLVDAAHTSGYQPRQLAFANGKAYVTTYASKIVVIDTLTNAISQYIDCRSGAEGIAITNNKMYVTVPGVYPASGDSLISVIDLATSKEVKTINAAPNPNFLRVDAYGHLFVICVGDYFTVPASLVTIDLNNDTRTKNDTTVQADNMTIYGNRAYLYKSTYADDSHSNVMTYDVQNGKALGNFITDGTTIQYFYGINADPATGNVYVIDALGGTSAAAKVNCFTPDGKLKYNFTLPDYGRFVSQIAFLR